MSLPPTGVRPRRIAIVGAGVTGLTAAWRLQQAGCQVQVFESQAFAGGRTRSVRKDGFVFDVGAITLLPTYTQTLALLDEIGAAEKVHAVHPVIGIPLAGQMHRIEVAHALRSLLQTQLIGWKDKARLLRVLPPLLRAWQRARFDTLSPLAPWDGVSIAQWSRRTLSEALLDRVIEPIIRGNTLNSTEDAPFGELLWMLRQYAAPCLYATDGGIDTLALTLAAKVPVAYQHTVTAVEPDAGAVRVHVDGASTPQQHFDACIIALPPAGLRALAPALSAEQKACLDALRPLPSVNVHLGLRQAPAATETFILPPPSEQAVLTTIVLDHLKAPGRCPAGKGVVSLFCRDTWSAQRMDHSDEQILAEVTAMAQPWLGDLSGQVESWHVQRWPYAIAKSQVGLYQTLQRWEQLEDVNSNVQLAGDLLSMGMEAAVIAGNRAAARLGG